MSTRTTKTVETVAELSLSPVWTNPRYSTQPPQGVSVEDAIIKSWFQEAGSECPECGNVMRHHTLREPVVARLKYADGPRLDNLVVLCCTCVTGN